MTPIKYEVFFNFSKTLFKKLKLFVEDVIVALLIDTVIHNNMNTITVRKNLCHYKNRKIVKLTITVG